VPARQPFRRCLWDEVVPWQDPVWCDPGAFAEPIDRSARRRPDGSVDVADVVAVSPRYDTMLRLRAGRIALFQEMCRRRDLPVPHNVRELLFCLAGFGLFTLTPDGAGDWWVHPRLTRNPVEVLPLSDTERDRELRAQRDDRAVLVAIEVRRLASRTRRRWRRRTIYTSLTGLADAAGVAVPEARQALSDLGQSAGLRVDSDGGSDGRLRLTVPWPDFRHRYPYAELPAPEHAI
jgi:hypothetical protein